MLNTKRIMAIGLLAIGAAFAVACSKESTASNAAQQSTSTTDMSVPNTPPATLQTAGATPTTTTSFEVYAKPPGEGLPISPASGASQNPLHTSSPVNTHDARRIGIDEVEALVQSGDAIIVDVRNEEAYEFQHIAGAKHIPLEELASRATQELPPTRWIIPYCT